MHLDEIRKGVKVEKKKNTGTSLVRRETPVEVGKYLSRDFKNVVRTGQIWCPVLLYRLRLSSIRGHGACEFYSYYPVPH